MLYGIGTIVVIIGLSWIISSVWFLIKDRRKGNGSQLRTYHVLKDEEFEEDQKSHSGRSARTAVTFVNM